MHRPAVILRGPRKERGHLRMTVIIRCRWYELSFLRKQEPITTGRGFLAVVSYRALLINHAVWVPAFEGTTRWVYGNPYEPGGFFSPRRAASCHQPGCP